MEIVRYKQHTSECSLAAISSICNYYDRSLTYEIIRSIVRRHIQKNLLSGFFCGTSGLIFNLLGFKRVTIHTCDLDFLDFSWKTPTQQLSALTKQSKSKNISKDFRDNVKSMMKFLSCKNNNLVVDYRYRQIIKYCINYSMPVLVGYNWTRFFRQPKRNSKFKPDPFNGREDYHSVVAKDYNDTGVQVIDSSEEYKGKPKKYRKKYYTMPWDDFLIAVSNGGELIVPSEYQKKCPLGTKNLRQPV